MIKIRFQWGMEMKKINITVYGAKQVCASCVGAPGSWDTFEWLQAAIARKYRTDMIDFNYIDIHEPIDDVEHQTFLKQIIDGEYLYPVICLNGGIVAEGVPRLKDIFQALNHHGGQLIQGDLQERCNS